ncbi:hypothetical protein [uncultured Corynebacterium sp.]|uniref:hypothetical protein n=1 Tax=uncultured Corynebacterium sp. TaxID=159447 RepID=UPI0028D11E42|nr:hypothetical protein [uncultured Corynebacterium sp.]
MTAFAQDPFKDANNLVQGLAGNLPQSQAVPGLPAAPPPANGGNETKPPGTAAVPSVTMPASPNVENQIPAEVVKGAQDAVDKVTQGMQALGDSVKASEETFEVEVEGEGVPDKAKVTITKKITDLTNGKVRLKGENWKTKDGKGSTILVRLKGYNAQTGAETIFKQENPATQQSPADGQAVDPEIYWKIKAEEDGTFEEERELPKNLNPGQGLKLAFETGAAANDIKRNKTTESLVIGGTEYVEKQGASALAAQARAAAPLQKYVEEKDAELTDKKAEAEAAVKGAAESAKAGVQDLGSAAANAVTPPQAPGGSAEPTDSGKTTAPETPPSTSSTTPPTTPSATPGPSSTPSLTPPPSSTPNNSGTSQKATTPTQPPKETKKQQESSSSDTIKDINYLLKEIKNVDKAFENLLGAAALAALSSSGGSNIPGLPGNNNIPGLPGGLSNSTKTATPTTPRAGGQGGTTNGTKPGTGTSGNGTAGKATGGTAGGTKTKTTTQKGTSTNALSGLGSLSSLLGGTPGRGTSVGGTRTSGTTTGGTSRSNSGTGATRSTGGTGATRTTTGTNGASSATGARVVNPSTNGRAAAGARAAGAAGSAKATTSNSASASSKPQPKHTPKPPVKTRDQLTQKNAHGVTGTLKNETLTMKIPRLKSGDWAYLYIYSADTTQKPVGIAWAQLDSTGSVKLDTKDLPDGEYTVAAVDEKDQLVGWVDMKLGEIKNAAFEGENDDKVVAAQAGVMSAADWWMIGASMLIPLLTASMIYAFRRPRRS